MRHLSVILCAVASVAWLLAFVVGARGGSVYLPLGAVAVLIGAVCVAGSAELRDMLVPRPRDIGIGVAVGVALLIATHIGFALIGSISVVFADGVSRLYAIAAVTPAVLPGVLAIVCAEELLWRGALPRALAPDLTPAQAGALSTFSYAAAQLGAGSALLGAAALGLGAVWMLLAHVTRGLLAPLLSHAIWTLGVLGFWPLSPG